MLDIWYTLIEKLKVEVPQSIFDIWFKPIQFDHWDPESYTLKLRAPQNKITSLRNTYLRMIEDAANGFLNHPITVTLLPIDETTGADTPIAATVQEVAERRREDTGLIPELTFENYVTGTANQLAVAAAEHVAQKIGQQYNPLYIYGGVGLGKTHLMQAIGHRYLDLNPGHRVRCVTAQDFIAEFTSAARDPMKSTKALAAFDERYRNLDLLLIDDVQSFSGAKGSQAQFYRAFEALVPHNKQLVMTGDTYTRGLKDIEPRLISRMSQGLSVAIEPPEIEMRVAILLNKANIMGLALPSDVAMYIAKRLKSNVRELEGALQQINAYIQFQRETSPVTIELVRHVLRDVLVSSNSQVSIENIQKVVADFYKIKVADMYSDRRPANIAKPRQIAMYLARTLTAHSLPEIGKNFGGRDHATVMHAVRKIKQQCLSNAELNHEIHVLEQMIKG